jgi:hypothetical protein
LTLLSLDSWRNLSCLAIWHITQILNRQQRQVATIKPIQNAKQSSLIEDLSV